MECPSHARSHTLLAIDTRVCRQAPHASCKCAWLLAVPHPSAGHACVHSACHNLVATCTAVCTWLHAGPGVEAAAARRRAAEKVLHEGLGRLGVDVQGLGLLRGGSQGAAADALPLQKGAGSGGSAHQGHLMQALEQAQVQQHQQQQQLVHQDGMMFGAAEPLTAASAGSVEREAVGAK